MSTNLIVRIEETTKKRFSRLVRIEGKSASEKVRELIDGYIKKADIGVVVDDLWDRVGTKMRNIRIVAPAGLLRLFAAGSSGGNGFVRVFEKLICFSRYATVLVDLHSMAGQKRWVTVNVSDR